MYRFIHEQSGSVAILLAVVATLILGVAGLAIDSGRIHATRSALKGASDAAALAAVAADTQNLSKKERRKLAKMYFHSNCGQGCGDIDTLKVQFKDNDQTVKIIAKSTISTSLGRVLGLETMHAEVNSAASTNKGYVNIYLALDNSESMNIPNTEADIDRFIDLLPRTWAGNGCTFACHGTDQTVDDGRTYFEVARDNNIELRQDFVRQSAIELVDILRQEEVTTQFSVGVMSFDYRVNVRQEVTDDLDQVTETLAGLSGASEYTDIHRVMTDIKQVVGEGGDGSFDNPLKFLVLVTDGVQNKWETEHGTVNADDCTEIKNSGDNKFMVLHIIYPDLEKYFPGLGANNKVVPYTQDRLDQLAECASPGLYFEANQGESILLAFQDIAQTILKRTPRLVQ